MHLYHINGKYVNDDGTIDMTAYIQYVKQYVDEVIAGVLKVKDKDRLKFHKLLETPFDEKSICKCKRHWKNDNTRWEMYD